MTTSSAAGIVRADRLNTQQAAEYLGYSVKTLHNMRYSGTGPASYKIGGRIWYDLRDLDVYIARCKAETLVGA